MKGLLVLVTITILSGCAALAPKVETVYVPDRTPIILRQDVKKVDIWAMNADSTPSAGNMTLEEGWF
jgi:hypothetical protein